MLAKIRGIIKMFLYILRSRNNIRFGGIPTMAGNSSINMIKGMAFLGKGFSMKPGAYCAIVNGGILAVGEGVSLNRNSIIVCHDNVRIGNNCAIAPNVMIYDHDHKFGPMGLRKGYRTSPVIIEDNCWIGAGVIILRGSHIGEGCVIGAGCVVKGEIPPHSLVVANRENQISPITFRQYGVESE